MAYTIAEARQQANTARTQITTAKGQIETQEDKAEAYKKKLTSQQALRGGVGLKERKLGLSQVESAKEQLGEIKQEVATQEQTVTEYETQVKAAEEEQAAYNSVMKAYEKGMLWAVAGFGEGRERQIAKQLIEEGYSPAKGGLLEQEAQQERSKLLKEIRLGNIPDISIQGNRIVGPDGKVVKMSNIQIPQEVYDRIKGVETKIPEIKQVNIPATQTSVQLKPSLVSVQEAQRSFNTARVSGTQSLNTDVAPNKYGFGDTSRDYSRLDVGDSSRINNQPIVVADNWATRFRKTLDTETSKAQEFIQLGNQTLVSAKVPTATTIEPSSGLQKTWIEYKDPTTISSFSDFGTIQPLKNYAESIIETKYYSPYSTKVEPMNEAQMQKEVEDISGRISQLGGRSDKNLQKSLRGKYLVDKPGFGSYLTYGLIPKSVGEAVIFGGTGLALGGLGRVAPTITKAALAGYGAYSVPSYFLAETPQEKASAAVGSLGLLAVPSLQKGLYKKISPKITGKVVLEKESVIIKESVPPRSRGVIEESLGQTRTLGKTEGGKTFQLESKGLQAKNVEVVAGERVKVKMKGGLINWLKGLDERVVYSGSYVKDRQGYNQALKLLQKREGLTKSQAQLRIKETKPRFIETEFRGQANVLSVGEEGPFINIAGAKVSRKIKIIKGDYETLGGKVEISLVKSKGEGFENIGKEDLTGYKFKSLELAKRAKGIDIKLTEDTSLVKSLGERNLKGRDIEYLRSSEVSKKVGGRKLTSSTADIAVLKGEPEFQIDLTETKLGTEFTPTQQRPQILDISKQNAVVTNKKIAKAITDIMKPQARPKPTRPISKIESPTKLGLTTIETSEGINLPKMVGGEGGVSLYDMEFARGPLGEIAKFQFGKGMPLTGMIVNRLEAVDSERIIISDGLGITGKTIQEPIVDFKDIQQDRLEIKNKPVEKSEIKSSTNLRYDTLNNLKDQSRLRSNQRSELKDVQGLKDLTQLKTVQQTKNTQRTNLKEVTSLKSAKGTKQPKPFKPTKPITPVTDDLVKRLSKKAKESPEFFEALVTKAGKDISIGKRRTQKEAEELLKVKLRTTLRAGGTILKGGRKIEAKELKEFGGGEFAISKVNPFKVIQKRERRLGTRAEVVDILGSKKKSKGKLQWL